MRTAALLPAAALCSIAAAQPPTVRALRVPDSGIQPQAVMAADGTLHLLYYKGDPQAGDLFYVKRPPGKPDFSAPIRVNSQPGSAIAIGNDRGGQIALGRNNRVHIAWNGSGKAEPKGPKSPAFSAENPSNGVPMLYTRLNVEGDAFEPQRNLMTTSFGLDGGGSVAATDDGRVAVVFHASPAGATGKSESERRVFTTISADDGARFASAEIARSREQLGACGCCGLKAAFDTQGQLRILFRAAGNGQDRDAILLTPAPSATAPTMIDTTLDPWKLQSCPMSTFAFGRGPGALACAWETAGNVYFSLPDSPMLVKTAAPGQGENRKYPSLAIDAQRRILLAWTEGMSWSKGGTAHWQLFSPDAKPIDGASGSAGPVPAWSLIAAIAEPDGSFDVFY